MKFIIATCILLCGFLAQGKVDNPVTNEELVAKINEMATLEDVDYVTLAQAEQIFDVENWRKAITQKRRKCPAILPYIANYFADQMRVAVARKNGKLKGGFVSAVIGEEELQRLRNMKLTVKPLAIRKRAQTYEVDILAYPDLVDPNMKVPDATVILRNTPKGIRVKSIRIEGVDIFKLALDGLQSVSDHQVTESLLIRELISENQIQDFTVSQEALIPETRE